MTRSWVALASVEQTGLLPSRMTSTRSDMASTSGRSEEMNTTATPAGGEVVDEPVDVGLGPHVDALVPARRG